MSGRDLLLTCSPSSIDVKGILRMSNFVDKSGRGILLAAINKKVVKPGIVLTFDVIELGDRVGVDVEGRDSQVVYSAVVDHPRLIGSQDAFFSRVDLENVFSLGGVATVQVEKTTLSGNTAGDVVDALNARYGTGFTDEDVIFDEEFEEGASTVVLSANQASYGYAGTLLVEIVEGKLELADIVDPYLDDLVVPVELPPYIVAITKGTGGIVEKGQKQDGNMLAGSGNPSGDLVVASNGEIQLAVGARVWRQPSPLPENVAGAFAFSIPENGDWNIPFSVVSLVEGRPVTELYDVTLNLGGINFTLTRDEGGTYHFINEQYELDISDSAQSESGDVVQNIQRLSHYLPTIAAVHQIEPNSYGEQDALLGTWSAGLYAVRREGLTAPVEVSITAVVSAPEPQ